MKGATLVILPGWGGSHETWEPFVALAKPQFDQVHVIDLPCFGTEPCPDHAWGTEEYVQFVSEKMEPIRASSSKIVLLGHSFGGAVATQYVTSYPYSADMLILAAAAVYRPRRLLRRVFFGAIAKVGKIIFRLPFIERFDTFARKVLYKGADSPDYSKTAGIKRDIYKKIIRQDQSHLLPKIALPTKVLWGKYDAMTPLRYGKSMAAAIDGASLAILEKGRHGLHHETKEEFLDLIEAFVATNV